MRLYVDLLFTACSCDVLADALSVYSTYFYMCSVKSNSDCATQTKVPTSLSSMPAMLGCLPRNGKTSAKNELNKGRKQAVSVSNQVMVMKHARHESTRFLGDVTFFPSRLGDTSNMNPQRPLNTMTTSSMNLCHSGMPDEWLLAAVSSLSWVVDEQLENASGSFGMFQQNKED